MIQNFEKFVMPDETRNHDFFVEVNWNPKDPKTNECKYLKITFPNGDECILKREHLNQVLFAIGNPEDQRKLIPQKIEKVHVRKTVLTIKAQKDIKKGEDIVVPHTYEMPCTFYKDVIGADAWAKEMKKNRSKLVLS